MVDAAKAFSKEPPKEPLTSLRAIVEDFQWRYVDRKKTDQVIAFCANAPDFPTAVKRAVEARDALGKHHNHQSKVDIQSRRLFGRRIIRRAQRGALDLTEFDEMHDTLDDIKPFGIGPVTVYDVAVRIGAYLGIEPRSVYLHAGVRQGYKSMVDALLRVEGVAPDTEQMYDARRWPSVPLAYFPTPLRDMRADDVEDILCTYRGVFEGWGNG